MKVIGAGADNGVWVFGYGSLIWRPGFEFAEQQQAAVSGYERRFCQASHDHRGTEQSPGRVVTLSPAAHSSCRGMAFWLEDSVLEVLDALDIREQDGYERTEVDLVFDGGGLARGVTWIAGVGNPSWRGGESLLEVAKVVAASEGPSGTNREYLYELNRALVDLGIFDQHVQQLESLVRGFSKTLD